jgi:hypothetical protein
MAWPCVVQKSTPPTMKPRKIGIGGAAPTTLEAAPAPAESKAEAETAAA